MSELDHSLDAAYEIAVNRRYCDPAMVLDLIQRIREEAQGWKHLNEALQEIDELKQRLHEAETETQRLLDRLSGGMKLAHQTKTRRLEARIAQLERAVAAGNVAVTNAMMHLGISNGEAADLGFTEFDEALAALGEK